MRIPSKKTSPSLWQRHASGALTYTFHHFLRYPHRKALALSIREQTSKLTTSQKSMLMDLLLEHKLIWTKFGHLNPSNLKHFHFCKTITKKQISSFIEAFNTNMDELTINFVAGQFSVIAVPVLHTEPKKVKPNLRAHIIGLLNKTNRPLTFDNIREELRKELPGTFNDIDVGIELGKLLEKDSLIATYAEKDEAKRFFLAERLSEIFGAHLDRPLLFRYEDGTKVPQYVFIKEAKTLVAQGKALKVLRADGSFSCVAEGHLNLGETTTVKSSKEPLRVLNSEIDGLIAKGFVIKGKEKTSFEPCFIDSRDQRRYALEIFNVFAHQFLGAEMVESPQRYSKLVAAFKAGVRNDRPDSIAEFLYEARMVASIGGSLTAIKLALTKNPASVKQLKKTGLFSPEEIEHLEACHHHLQFMVRFPLLFVPSYAHSLQNFIHFIYDKTEYFEVFQLLLVSKLDQLRRLARVGGNIPIPPNFRHQIELVYAPLAERNGYIDIANNMRDLIARLDSPEIYNSILEAMESTIGMTRNEARAHLINRANVLKANIEANTGIRLVGIHTRVKEIYAIRTNIEAGARDSWQITSADQYATEAPKDAIDFLGLRIICETLEEAEQIVSHLRNPSKNNLAHPSKKALPRGKKMIENNLRRARTGGWKGWRAYFIDPADPENKRIISIQVLTQKMQKKDQRGKGIAHWAYKARRAAQEASRGLRTTIKKQRFDAAPIDQYTNDAEHNYHVNQTMARQHNRVFIWFDNWGTPGAEFSLNKLFPPIDGMMPILRLEEGETIEDAIAFRGYNDCLTKDYSHTEVYRLALDEQNGRVTPQPYFKGQARALLGLEAPNAALLVFRTGSKPTRKKLLDINRNVQSIRAKLLVQSALSSKTRDQLIAEGNKHPKRELIDSEEKMQQIQKATRLRSAKEVLVALALGLIDDKLIQKNLGVFEAAVTINQLKNRKQAITITTPEKPQLFTFLLGQLEGSKILGAQYKVNQQDIGVSPANMEFLIQLPPTKGKKTGPNSNLQTLKNKLDKYLAAPARAADTTTQAPPNYTQLRLTLSSQNNWNILFELIHVLNKYNLSVIKLNLPNTSAKSTKHGVIIVEANEEEGLITEKLEEIRGIIKAALHKTSQFTLDEIN